MHDFQLRRELAKVTARCRQLRMWTALGGAWLVAAMIVALLWQGGLLGQDMTSTVLIAGGIALALGVVAGWRALAAAPDSRQVALRIERTFPELESGLLAALDQRPETPGGEYGFLQASVIRQALVHAQWRDWSSVAPARRLAAAIVGQFAALALWLLALWAATARPLPAATDAAAAHSRETTAGAEFAMEIEPGDTQIERGTSLLVLARITGAIPADATLVYAANGEDETRLRMSPSLDDPVFGGRLAQVDRPIAYHVELGDRVSPTYRVEVFEYPRLERVDARLIAPEYTGLEERLIQDVRTLSVVEGTKVVLQCLLNKRVARAAWSESERPEIELVAVAGETPLYEATILCQESRRLTLELVDDAGRRNVVPAQLRIQVVPNQPPQVKLQQPARDLDVSPLEELDVAAQVWDDYGLQRAGLTYSRAGDPPVDVLLVEQASPRERRDLKHTLRLEALQVQPDDLLTYFVWAEDRASDGSIRRTQGDMYFAEVRPFEEIFRQGQAEPGGAPPQGGQPPGGAGQAAAAQQLAELQKEIINATWKLIRRETGAKPTPPIAEDISEVSQSQTAALEQAQGVAEKLNDSQSQAHIGAVLEAMKKAVAHLESARSQPSARPLPTALGAEQAAYAGLLKLRAREHEIVRQQRQQGSPSSAQARSQQQRQQMQELDLAEEENRYETQRLARSESESQQDRETRQVLNRLKELARRQHDLNERLKELQSALQEADSPQRQEEVRRQLKRLQEEQDQILRDTDELQARMDTPENQQRMSDERQQLEEARDQVRRAAQALDQQQVTQAAASGSRAEREFDDLRNEFRKQSSERFRDEVREMLEESRALDQRERELGEQLAREAQPDPAARTLRDGNDREEIATGLAEQRTRLAELVEQMRETIQEAETTEPLLSEKLYDAAREVQNKALDRALEGARQSVARGWLEDARPLEQQAAKGLSDLRQQVERAAESVLGDETEALRRARDELQQLARELNEDIERNAPEGQRSPTAASNRPNTEETETSRRDNRSGRGRPTESRDQGERTGQRDGEGDGQVDERRDGQNESGASRTGNAERRDNESRGAEERTGRPERSPRSLSGEPRIGRQGGENPPRGGERPEAEGQNEASPSRTGNGEPRGAEPRGAEPRSTEERTGRPERSPRSLSGEPTNGPPNGENPQRGAGRRAEARNSPAAPISGGDFLDWSDRLRDVEEMVNDPELRAEAARIRERARSVRGDMQRHSKPPQWPLVRSQIAEPLAELMKQVSEELLRRNSKQMAVPLDRDPVPPRYSERSRQYYERLGSGQ
ncbi:MAG: DUF4175 family protein [Planctomycetales bacterium]